MAKEARHSAIVKFEERKTTHIQQTTHRRLLNMCCFSFESRSLMLSLIKFVIVDVNLAQAILTTHNDKSKDYYYAISHRMYRPHKSL